MIEIKDIEPSTIVNRCESGVAGSLLGASGKATLSVEIDR